MFAFTKQKAPTSGTVYKLVATGGMNHLALLVGVDSSDPQKTIEDFLRHAAVTVNEAPTEVPTLAIDSPKLDLIIRAIDRAPGYEVLNRLKQSPLEGLLKD